MSTHLHPEPVEGPNPPDPLAELTAILDRLRQTYGPFIIAPPENAQSPVAVLLPLDVRYCTHCQHFRPKSEMISLDHCQHCVNVHLH